MDTAVRHVLFLFLCTGNSARSILAEALMGALGKGRFRAHSAGSHPKGAVHPLALQTLRSMGVSTQGLRSKAWDEFASADAPSLDLVITVCDQAAGETCPFWPGAPVTVHWGMPDPAAITGDDAAEAFLDTARMLKQHIERLLALPVDALDHPRAARRLIEAIGTS